MSDNFFLDSTVHIISAKGESYLGKLWPDHYPVGFNMREVIQHKPGHRNIFQVINTGCSGMLGHRCVFWMKGQRYIGQETAGLILSNTQGVHVLQSLLDGLDMAVQKGCIRI